MNCNEVKEIIQIYMDSELDARNTLEAQRHLDGCPSCLSLLNVFLDQDRLLKETALAETSDNGRLRKEILQALPKDVARARGSVVSASILKRAAAIAVIATLAAIFFLRGATPFIENKVYAAAAADHAAHCSMDKLVTAISDTDQINRLMDQYGQMKNPPDLSLFGFGELRAKECPINGVRWLHLIYHDSSERPLSVYIAPRGEAPAAGELVVLEENGYEVASIARSGINLMVVSSLDKKQTSEIARAITAQL